MSRHRPISNARSDPKEGEQRRWLHDGFISYRHSDGMRVTRWLRSELQSFRAPAAIQRHLRARDGAYRPLRIAWDESIAIASSSFKKQTILTQQGASKYLIVVASPSVREPNDDGTENWVEREVGDFLSLPHADNVVAVVGTKSDPPLPNALRRFTHMHLIDVGHFDHWTWSLWTRWWLRDRVAEIVGRLHDLPPHLMEDLKEAARRQQRRDALRMAVIVIAMVAAGLVAWQQSIQKHVYADLAQRRSEDVTSLAAVKELDNLTELADTLWPVEPDIIARLDAWVRRADRLVSGCAADAASGRDAWPSLAEHEARLDALRQKADPRDPARLEADDRASPVFDDLQRERARLRNAEAASAGSGPLSPESERSLATLRRRVARLEESQGDFRQYAFRDEDSRRMYQEELGLVSKLRRFTDADVGGLHSTGTSDEHGWGIGRRLEVARRVEALRTDPATIALWQRAIADIENSERYGRMRITPQVGLVPLGRDPESGVWEFAHVQTGEVPVRGADGRLIRDERTALILVLIPGGTFEMGAQNQNEHASNFDPSADGSESPILRQRIEPFFLSKYEMTQGQWQNLTGRNPSKFGQDGFRPEWNEEQRHWTPLHPVERVSWIDCERVLGRVALKLPSEKEWEYAARAGTTERWSTGRDAESLKGYANVADAFATSHGRGVGFDRSNDVKFSDYNVMHAEVGSYRPNRFGLHDMHGNVAEWCEDVLHRYNAFGEVDASAEGSQRIRRGGSFDDAPADAGSGRRFVNAPGNALDILGVRPARALR